MVPAKLTALSAKQTPSPSAATTQPARAGPITRAPFTTVELSASAFGMSSPAISPRRAWRAGISNRRADAPWSSARTPRDTRDRERAEAVPAWGAAPSGYVRPHGYLAAG